MDLRLHSSAAQLWQKSLSRLFWSILIPQLFNTITHSVIIFSSGVVVHVDMSPQHWTGPSVLLLNRICSILLSYFTSSIIVNACYVYIMNILYNNILVLSSLVFMSTMHWVLFPYSVEKRSTVWWHRPALINGALPLHLNQQNVGMWHEGDTGKCFCIKPHQAVQVCQDNTDQDEIITLGFGFTFLASL